MVINGVVLHNEGFVMLLAFIISGLWIYSSRRNVNIMSAKVADILDSKFNLTTQDLLNHIILEVLMKKVEYYMTR